MSSYSNKDIEKTVNRRDIVIVPINKNSITPLGYDISIGEIITLSSASGDKILKEGGNIKIPPKSLNIVVAKEFIWLSKNVIGTLHARGTLAAKGILTNSTNVDPNFGGQMIMSLYNSSDRTVILNEEDSFITLIFHTSLTPTLDGPGWKKTARVIADLKSEYGPEEIQKLDSYMNAKNTEYGSEFNDLIALCKKWGPIKSVKSYIYTLRSNHGSNFLKLITDAVFTVSLIFLFVSFVQVMYYTYTGESAKALPEKQNLYVLLAAFVALGINKIPK
jgi:deoxycytidine triphosphate deaminase